MDLKKISAFVSIANNKLREVGNFRRIKLSFDYFVTVAQD